MYDDDPIPAHQKARLSIKCRMREIRTLPLWLSDGPLRNHMLAEGTGGVHRV